MSITISVNTSFVHMKQLNPRRGSRFQKRKKVQTTKRQLIYLNIDEGYHTLTVEPVCPFKDDKEFKRIKQNDLNIQKLSIAVKLSDIIKIVFYTNHRISIHYKVCRHLLNNKAFVLAMNKAIKQSEARISHYISKYDRARKKEYIDKWHQLLEDEYEWHDRIMDVKANMVNAAKSK